MSNSKESRVEEGLALLRDIQLHYETVITEENLPYVAAASIISGGPFFHFSQELDELIIAIEAARDTVVLVRDAVVKWNTLLSQEEVSEKA